MMLIALIVSLLACALDGAYVPKADNRIVGGQEADIADYGYQVSVRRDGKHTCGGAILNNYWILTASHCINDNPSIKYEIRVGSSKKDVRGFVYEIAEVKKHPLYTLTTFNCDVAVLRVKEPIRLNGRSVRAIKLINLGQEVPVGTNVTVAGWGNTEAGGHAEHLRMVSLSVVDWKKCKEAYAKENGDITENMLCAAADEPGKDSCGGDSGGPIVDWKKDTVFGVVSFGNGCGEPGFPGVYANLAAKDVRDFIKEHTGL